MGKDAPAAVYIVLVSDVDILLCLMLGYARVDLPQQ